MRRLVWSLVPTLFPLTLLAGQAEIVDARATAGNDGSYRVDVTLRHADTGWDHYADAWDLLLPDGRLLATRTLYHPHVNEQPFTRSLGDVSVPQGTDHLWVRAHDKVHGYNPERFQLFLNK